MLKFTVYVEPYAAPKSADASLIAANTLAVLTDPVKLKLIGTILDNLFGHAARASDGSEAPEAGAVSAGAAASPGEHIHRQNVSSGEPVAPAEASTAPAPVAAPQASAAGSLAESREAAMNRHAALLLEGEQSFDVLIRTWTQNYGATEAPQPDRVGSLMGCITGHGPAVGAYIRERGGLAGACIDSIVRQSLVAVEDAVRLGQDVALNMVQVGSAVGVPLDTLLEKSMFRRELHDKPPTPGTLPATEFDRSTLPLPK